MLKLKYLEKRSLNFSKVKFIICKNFLTSYINKLYFFIQINNIVKILVRNNKI